MGNGEMSGGRRSSIAVLVAAASTALAVSVAHATTGDVARGGGVQVTLPSNWTKVVPARDRVDDPRTLLVVGTDGSRAIESDCQVSSYRVPADGAVVVVIGWRTSVGGASFFPLSGLKLRRGTFECFPGRGAVARITRRDRDFQVNVMVGDKADASTVADALETARSFTVAPRA
jgi:hypothetical protein